MKKSSSARLRDASRPCATRPARRARSAPARDRRSASRWRCCRRPCRWRAPAPSRSATSARRDRDAARRDAASRRRASRRRRCAEPMAPLSIASKPATRPSQMIFFRSRNRLVIQSPTSVAPPSSTASGWRGIEIGERGLAGGRGEEARLVADEEIAAVLDGAAAPARRARRSRGEPVRRRAVAGRERRVDDRAIAGAAAEIAGERLVDALARRRLAAVIMREQAHHDAGRAEAALRAVQVDHRLLHGMQRLALGEILDGEQFRAVDLAEQQDAGVDRGRKVSRRRAPATARPCRRRNRPRAQPSFVPLRARLLAQPVEQRRARRETREIVRVWPRKRKVSSVRGPAPSGSTSCAARCLVIASLRVSNSERAALRAGVNSKRLATPHHDPEPSRTEGASPETPVRFPKKFESPWAASGAFMSASRAAALVAS